MRSRNLRPLDDLDEDHKLILTLPGVVDLQCLIARSPSFGSRAAFFLEIKTAVVKVKQLCENEIV